jgi:hypothetical protein
MDRDRSSTVLRSGSTAGRDGGDTFVHNLMASREESIRSQPLRMTILGEFEEKHREP